MSAERPILFSGPLVRAILAGQKTQTRRPVTERNSRIAMAAPPRWSQLDWSLSRVSADASAWVVPVVTNGVLTGVPGVGVDAALVRSRIEAGDLLYVRETWAPTGSIADPFDTVYRASVGDDVPASATGDGSPDRRWHPSIHMPKSRARIWLRVTAVSEGRVLDMTEADARAEGFSARPHGNLADFYRTWGDIYGRLPADEFLQQPVHVVHFKVDRIVGGEV